MVWSYEEPVGEVSIGHPFPRSDLIIGAFRRAWTLLSGPTVLFLIVIPELGRRDLPRFESAPVKFGVAWEKGVVYLLMDFDEWLAVEAPMDPYLHERAARETFTSAGGTKQNLPVVLVEGSGQVVRGIRLLPLRRTVMDEVRRLYLESTQIHDTQRSVRDAIGQTLEGPHPGEGALFRDRAVTSQGFDGS
jgi:hypothetical protein